MVINFIRLRSTTIAAMLITLVAAHSAPAADDPPQHGTPTAVFATDPNAGSNAGKAPAGAAASVDGHIIPLSSVVAVCLRNNRAQVVDQMIQNYVVDRECKRRGMIVSEAQIDKRIAALRGAVAPQTLEQVIAAHHSTMVRVRDDFRHKIALDMLVADQVPIAEMAHCRVITIKFCPPGVPAAIAGTARTETETQVLVSDIQKQLTAGQDFSTLAAKYAVSGSGDLGIFYPGKRDVDSALIAAGLALDKGHISPEPVKTANAYSLVQTMSTRDSHTAAEDATYADAQDTYQDQQAQFLGPKFVVDLINKSHITFAADADLDPSDGNPLPKAAATVDGHSIAMEDVVAECLSTGGPRVADILVQNYVVDQECRRRSIEIEDAEIDKRVAALTRALAPHTLDEGLQMHHMTMAALRSDFRQDIERERLVSGQVKPTKMVRCRFIEVPFLPEGSPGSAGHTAMEVQSLMAGIQSQLKAGISFASLAAQYPASEIQDQNSGTVLYAGMHDLDTAVLNAGLALSKGEITAEPIKTTHSYCLIQAVSTSDDHAAVEDAPYADALAVYTEQEAQKLIPQAIVALIKKSKVVYYVHA